MNRHFKTVPATITDAIDLADRLTNDDYAELEANHSGLYIDVKKLLTDIIKEHEDVFVVINKLTGTRYAIGGYSNGSVWMLTSEYVTTFKNKERSRFIAELLNNLNVALQRYPVLSNYIWVGNPMHIKLVRHMGASMQPKVLSQPGDYYIPFSFTQ